MTNAVDEYGPGDEHLGGASATQFGPAGSLAFGVDFPVASFLALGFELRGGFESFGDSRPVIKDAIFAPDYGTLAVVSLGIGGTLLIAD